MSAPPTSFSALVLAGGRGTRFWPLSREARPKQLLALDGTESLLRRTVARLEPLVAASDVWVCTTAGLGDAVRRELPEVPEAQILCEPEGRDTAPAIGWAMRQMTRSGGDPVVAILPADHRVEDTTAFCRALAAGRAEVERSDRIMTLGVEPRWAETGYGYLELGSAVAEGSPVRLVSRFTEKPDAETARRFVAAGNFLWNAGIFVFRAGQLTALLRRFEPRLASILDEIDERPEELAQLYGRLPRVSIDYAVMERAEGLGTLPLDCGWSDLGSWTALAEVMAAKGVDNVTRGDVVSHEAVDNLVFAEERLVAVVGVSGLVIVQTDDAVLVVPRERAQDVKAVVEKLRQAGRSDLL